MSKIPESELARLRKRIEQVQNFGQKVPKKLRRRYEREKQLRGHDEG